MTGTKTAGGAAGEATLVGRWRDLQERYLTTAASIERGLNSEHGLGLSDFEVLDLIAENDDPDSPCRMKDLSKISPMTQSALSRIVDRLEKSGLVTRNSCAEDRRALMVSITDQGHQLHQQAQQTHRRLLRETLGS
ncbi:MarR family winged helix-turn-helix transcriptional regulator [Microlunatus soli]|uniref:DNA-binding transcriptional regulator, MarR family n=1 Tax=Microlunatus soli TaxID=630515 RepID=A0A1H1TJX7_9ACTN|nr:MarR family transcriptional regulator [Microlunatus soli]SDS60530.1 DNA-binding transcriptional regulator, MarR family [Microlunatus soli]